MVAGHVGDSARSEQPDPVELAAPGQHLGEPVTVCRGRGQPAPAVQQRRVEDHVTQLALRGHPAGSGRDVQGGEPLDVPALHPECRVVHAQRAGDPVADHFVQRLPADHFEQPAEHPVGKGVVPFGARGEQQGQARVEVHRGLEIDTRRAGPLIPPGPQDRIDRMIAVESVGESRGVGEQVPDPDRFGGRCGDHLEVRTVDVHALVGERRQVPRHRVGELEGALLIEHQGRDGRDRLGQGVDPPQRVGGDRPVGLQVPQSAHRVVHHPAAPCDHQVVAGDPSVVDVELQRRVDPGQRSAVHADLPRVGLDRVAHRDLHPLP